MIKYLPALGEHVPTNGYATGLAPAALGVTNGLRTSWEAVRKIMRGSEKNLQYTWNTEILLHPEESSLCLFDSGLFSVFGIAKQDAGFNLEKFFSSYAPAYRDYINYVLEEIPENSREHAFFVNLDTDFLLGIEKTREFNEMLLKSVPGKNLIGTYHAADGKKYLDELIEKFDYIAIADGYKLDNDMAVPYLQGVAEYVRNKKPDSKVHILGRTDSKVFRALSNIATSCDSSSYMFRGRPDTIIGTDLSFNHFWNSGFDYDFCKGMEKVRTLFTCPFTDIQYTAMVTEVVQLYATLCLANRYSPQIVRKNCPVRDALDDIFGVPHSSWKDAGRESARYVLAWESEERKRKVRRFRFQQEPTEGAVDIASFED